MPADDALPGPAANEPGSPRLVLPCRVQGASAGVDWIADGWRLFRKAPLMWIVFLVLLILLNVGLSFLPVVGNLLTTLLSPVILGGIAVGCRSLETGGELDLEHLLVGFRRNTGMLFAIGVVYMLGQVALLGVFAMFVGWSLVWAALTGGMGFMTAMTGGVFTVALGGLVVATLAIPLVAAIWFAPVLAMLHDQPALPAMKESLVACLGNWLPMLVYGLIMLALAVVAVIPAGLGMLVWIPMLFTTNYTAYRGIFTEPDAQAA